MRKPIRNILKWFGIIIAVLILLYLILFTYVYFNKKGIIKQITTEIGKKLNGNLTIDNVDLNFTSQFPQASVDLHNVLLTDTMYSKHHHPFFKGEDVFIKVSVWNLIFKKPAISGFKITNGSVYVYTDTTGYTNKYLFEGKHNTKPDTATIKAKSELKIITLHHVEIIEDDKKKEKLHDVLVNDIVLDLNDKDERTFGYGVKINALIKSLAFNSRRGSFVKGKVLEGNFEMQYDKKLKQLQFDSIDISLSGQPLNLTGRFDLEGPSPQFLLNVHAKGINYGFGKSLLTPFISTALSIVNIDKAIDVDAYLKGPLKGGDPLINVFWKVERCAMVTPFLNFEDATFTGSYTDEVVAGQPRTDPNSRIIINDFKGKWNGLPIYSKKMDILNLQTPLLTCDLNSHFPLTSLADIIGYNTLDLRAGEANVNLTYSGPLAKNNSTNSFVNGTISISGGDIFYVTKNVDLKNVAGRILFRNSDVIVENLQTNVLGNKLVMNGQAKNLLTLLNTEPTMARIQWSVYSPFLNLNNFTSLLKSKKRTTDISAKKGKLNTVSKKVDQVIQQGSLDVSLKADRLLYKKFDATNVNAELALLEESYTLKNVRMDNAGGHITLSGSLVTPKSNYHEAKLNIGMDNVDVSKVFTTFDNFNQDGITAGNLQGKLTAKIGANLLINDEGKIYPNSVKSTVDFSLLNGALINFEPIKKLQSFVFKKRDFDNINFAELKDHLEINGDQVKISRMEIQSSVFSMFVEGVYGMKGGNTDLSIQLPLSNLKKRKADYNPENIGTDSKGGPSVHVRGQTGPDGKVKFKLDLFNKFKKEKQGATNQ
ncbi:MAG: hypothetical protein NVS3B19_17760 [Ginsengibacter sp.]